MQKILKVFKSWEGLFATFGTIIPGYTFFRDTSPSFFEPIGIITTALGFVVFILCAKSKKKPKRSKVIFSIIISFALICLYIALLRLTTIEITDASGDKRFQIGFHLYSFSLTDQANKMIRDENCQKATPVAIINNCVTGEMDERIEKIWKKEMIIIAGLLNILVFTSASLL